MSDRRILALRSLPSVSALLENDLVREAAISIRPDLVAAVARRAQDLARMRIQAGDHRAGESLIPRIVDELRLLTSTGTPVVINGTGVIIQTNLGRAPVSTETAEVMCRAASGYLALETKLDTGERGGRGDEIGALMRVLTGAERTLVVNNNAAAVMLLLAATSAGRKVIVSRGEAVEIGGGFRVPDVLQQSGALLAEVGTTNRTYVHDYARAIDEHTAALLRVHTSNFAIVGFTSRPALSELAQLAHQTQILALEDVGSGCLIDTSRFGLEHEPTLGESIAAGMDVICASGDKLLGGPQAGLILGRAEIVEQVRRHPLARALRADKTALAGIAETLRHYARGDAIEKIPVWWSISRSVSWLESRVRGWIDALGDGVDLVQTEAVIGGGSLPGQSLPSVALVLRAPPDRANDLARRLRTGSIPIVPRIIDGHVAIDARTVLPDQDQDLLLAIAYSNHTK